MRSYLSRINPILKIFFILFELICIYFFQNSIVTYSVLLLLLICLVTSFFLMKKSLIALLNISPLLFTIFLLGFIFGNPYQTDLQIILHIIILVCFSAILIHTTSSYDFLQSFRATFPNKISEPISVFLYGFIFFFPIFQKQIHSSLFVSKMRYCKKSLFSKFPGICITLIEKTLQKVHSLSLKSNILLQTRPVQKFTIFDGLVIMIVITQISIVFL